MTKNFEKLIFYGALIFTALATLAYYTGSKFAVFVFSTWGFTMSVFIVVGAIQKLRDNKRRNDAPRRQ
jgi:hypothetical protein